MAVLAIIPQLVVNSAQFDCDSMNHPIFSLKIAPKNYLFTCLLNILYENNILNFIKYILENLPKSVGITKKHKFKSKSV